MRNSTRPRAIRVIRDPLDCPRSCQAPEVRPLGLREVRCVEDLKYARTEAIAEGLDLVTSQPPGIGDLLRLQPQAATDDMPGKEVQSQIGAMKRVQGSIDLNGQTRFLQSFATSRRPQAFSRLNHAAGEAPQPRRGVAVLKQENSAFGVNDGERRLPRHAAHYSDAPETDD